MIAREETGEGRREKGRSKDSVKIFLKQEDSYNIFDTVRSKCRIQKNNNRDAH